MLSHLKFACILLCAGCVFSSCFTSAVSNRTPYASKETGGEKPVSGDILYRNDIPACAMRQLLKQFPAADDINWKKGARTGWIAGFKTGTVETRMDFDARGDWYRIYNIYSAAPADVRDAVAKEYSDYKISSVYSVLLPADQYNVKYNIVIRRQDNLKVLTLSKGTLSVFTDLDNSKSAD